MAEYIDRDGYIKLQRELHCKNCPKREGTRNGKKQELYPFGGVVCRACELNDALDALEDFPAADVAPVKRGRLDEHAKFEDCIYAKCSECGVSQIFYYNKPLTNYCPNCGAKTVDKDG